MTIFNRIYTTEDAHGLLFNQDSTHKDGFKLISVIKKAPVVHISLSFNPSPKFIQQISSEIRKVLSDPTVLLDITVDPNLIGGAIFSFKGKYLDESIKAKL